MARPRVRSRAAGRKNIQPLTVPPSEIYPPLPDISIPVPEAPPVKERIEEPFYKRAWFKILSYFLAASVAAGGVAYGREYLDKKAEYRRQERAIASQLSYLPESMRSDLVTGMKPELDWDMDGVLNGKDSFVLDPTNAIAQPKPETVNFIRDLKEQNGNKLLPQAYSKLSVALYTVDNNTQYFQETTPARAHAAARLVEGIDSIRKYPRALSLAAVEAESQKLTDDNSMNSFVVPAVRYAVRLQEEGKIDVLNGLEKIEDKSLENLSMRQVLLPEELRMVNIRTGVRRAPNLETGIFNVTPNPELNGLTPEEWLREMAERDYNDKNSAAYLYVSSNWDKGSFRPYLAWPNSGEFYLKSVKNSQAQDDLLQFITNYPVFIRIPHSGSIVPKLTEQGGPYYSVLLGRLFGRPTFVVTANYPKDMMYKDDPREGTHDEAYVLTNDGIFFGYWLDKDAFLKDYEGKANKPRLEGKYNPF